MLKFASRRSRRRGWLLGLPILEGRRRPELGPALRGQRGRHQQLRQLRQRSGRERHARDLHQRKCTWLDRFLTLRASNRERPPR